MFLMATLLILLLAPWLAAQTPAGQVPGEQREAPAVFRSEVTLVRVDTQVIERNRTVTGLTASDFLVFDEGQPQSIAYFGRDSDPIDLVLLLDVSGSVQRYLAQIGSTAQAALDRLSPQDRIAIMLFARRSSLIEDFTANRARIAGTLKDSLRDHDLGSGTAINSAILAAAGQFAPDRPATQAGRARRRAVLIVTDNQGLNYQSPDETVIRALYEADAVLNALVVGRGQRPKPPRPGEYRNPDFTPADVFRLAEETGGEVEQASNAGRAFSEMLERLRTRYALEYSAPSDPDDASFRRIRVELAPEARKRYPKAEIRTRSGYYPARR
jgi:VWFA-related protein